MMGVVASDCLDAFTLKMARCRTEVEMGETKSKGGNVSASSFGWEFQVAAAIVLVLDNILELSNVRVEGAHEDIELSLENGMVIYAQAKSAANPYKNANIKTKLHDALKSLNRAASGEPKEYKALVYVTNIPTPTGIGEVSAFEHVERVLSFSELDEESMHVVENIVASENFNKIDLNTLSFHTIPFCGDQEQSRYGIILRKIGRLLEKVSVRNSLDEKILDVWRNAFHHNSSEQNLSSTLSKNDVVWPIIVTACEMDVEHEFTDEFSDIEVDEVFERYQRIIGIHSMRYDLVRNVIYSYRDYGYGNKSNDIQEFINEHWTEFKSMFPDSGCGELELQTLVKYTLFAILRRRNIVGKISKELKLK